MSSSAASARSSPPYHLYSEVIKEYFTVLAAVDLIFIFTLYVAPCSNFKRSSYLSLISQSLLPTSLMLNTAFPSVKFASARLPTSFTQCVSPDAKFPFTIISFGSGSPGSTGGSSTGSVSSNVILSITTVCFSVMRVPPTAPRDMLNIVLGSVSSPMRNTLEKFCHSPVSAAFGSPEYGVQSSLPLSSLCLEPSLCSAYIIVLSFVDLASKASLYHLSFSSLISFCFNWICHAASPVSAISMANAFSSSSESTI